MLEVLNLDEKGKTTRELVNDSLLTDIKDKIAAAGEDLRANRLPRLQSLVLDVRRLRPGRPVQDAPVAP